MNNTYLPVCACLCLVGLAGASKPTVPTSEWTLVWTEEFDQEADRFISPKVSRS